MLDAAQELVAVGEFVAHFRADPAALGEAAECADRIALAQVLLTATGDELLRLREELDLANAATADLDVVAGDADGAEAFEGVDLPLHRMDVGDRGEVEILAPDEWRELFDESVARRDVASYRARLDHGGAFPILAEALVVVERRVG